MNTRRSAPPPSHSKLVSHQVAQLPHSTTCLSLTYKPAATGSVQGRRRSPVEDWGSQPAQSLPSIRDHLHPYLPPIPPDSGPSSLVALPSFATPAFGGYIFQPSGSYPYSHQPLPPLGYARAAPPHHLPSRPDDSGDDEHMADPSSRRRRTFSGGQVSEGVEGSRQVYGREHGEDHGGSGSGMDLDTEGPPKRKKRRHAWSCAECQRRKIKCDSSRPCDPCTRRGEQAKCPGLDISRHEFDEIKKGLNELKKRHDDLEMRFEYFKNICLCGASHSRAGHPPSVQSGSESSQPLHLSESQSMHPPPTQSLPSHFSSFSGVAGPPPAQPPPSLGSRTQRGSESECEQKRELRHTRSSPTVGSPSRHRKV
ncbi:hypothetical protein PM082_016129 [Marasmius tenuissimus]|nr:hypothetical protein PM082_016129 [Marasmius tenuissimus]